MLRWQGAAVAGLMAAVVLTALAVSLERNGIEIDLSDRASVALSGEATEWARVSVSGRDLTLTGSAPEQDLLTLADTRLARVFGVRSVDASGATLLPEEKPYVVTLTRGGDSILVGGVAPSDPERRRLLARVAANFPNLGTADALELARGMPDKDWLGALTELIPIAGDLSNGRVMLKDHVASIDGEAASNEAYERLRDLKVELPKGYSLEPPVVVRPVASPFSLSAILDEGRVLLSGYAPDEATLSRIADAASAGGTLPVESRVDLASGEPQGFAAAAVAGLDFLDLFTEGRVDLSDRRISVSGTAASPEAWRTLNSHLATFRPDGFTVDVSIDLPVISPFVLTAIRNGDSVTVTGFAPTTSSIEDIRSAADQIAAGTSVVETTLAAGAPNHFTEAATFAVRLLDHVETGTVVLADDRVTVSGIASSSGDLLELEASIALEAPDGFTVENNVQPPVVAPYTWSLERTSDSFVLSGYVPTEAVRVAVRDAADDAAGDLAVTDRTALAAGLPTGVDLAAVAAFAASEVALLDEGRVELIDRTVSLKGKTADALAGRSAVEAFQSMLPAGLTPGTIEVETPNPFSFRIERESDGLLVEGMVADEASENRIMTAIERLFGTLPMEVTLRPNPESPPVAEAALIEALRAASELSTGTVVITDRDIAVDGVAFTAAAAERVETVLPQSIPEGWTARTTVRPAPPPTTQTADSCQITLNGISGHIRLGFSAADDVPDVDSAGSVAALAAGMIGCQGARFTLIVGDPNAADAAVLTRRAAALADSLVNEGVPAESITAKTVTGRAGVSVVVEGAAARPRSSGPSVFRDILKPPELDTSPPLAPPPSQP